MENYHEVILVLVTLVLGFLGMPLTNFFKSTFNIVDKGALALAGLVAAALAVAELFLMGQITPDALTLEQFPGTFGLIYASAMFWYRMLAAESKPEEPEPFTPEAG